MEVLDGECTDDDVTGLVKVENQGESTYEKKN